MTEQRERTERKTDEQQQRRRRTDGTLDATQNKKLAIPEEIEARLKAEGLTPRWANDEGNRIHNLTVKDDYERVEGVKPVPVGMSQDGKPIMAHLLAKRNDFIAEDREAADKRRRDTEDAMMRAHVPQGGNPSNPAAPSQAVYAAKGNSIGRENRIIE